MKLVLVCSSSVFTNIDCINFCCLHLFVTLLAELCICLGNLYHSACSMLYSYFSIMWRLVCCTAASEVTFWATKWLFCYCSQIFSFAGNAWSGKVGTGWDLVLSGPDKDSGPGSADSNSCSGKNQGNVASCDEWTPCAEKSQGVMSY